MHKYDIGLEEGKQDVLNIMLKHIKPESTILEMGCGNGRLTKKLKEELFCDVYIVEYNKSLYQKALPYAKEGICSDIMSLKWKKTFSEIRFDYILFADVLEHLLDPEKILRQCRGLLAENGIVMVSLPNIAHNDILLQLYDNSLKYSSSGIMDSTHLHIFTYSSICDMFSSTGWVPVYEDCVSRETGTTEQLITKDLELTEFVRLLDKREMKNVYQFLFFLVPSDQAETVEWKSMIKEHGELLQRRVFFDYGEGYHDEDQLIFYVRRQDRAFNLNFQVPEGTKTVRVDMALNMPCRISALKILSNRGNVNITSNGEGEDPIVFRTMKPVVYCTDLDGVRWLSFSGMIEYGFDIMKESEEILLSRTREELEILQNLLKEKEEVVKSLEESAARKETEFHDLCRKKEEEAITAQTEKEKEITRIEAEKEKEITILQAEKEEEITRLQVEKEEEITRLQEEKEETVRLKAEREEEIARLQTEKEETARLKAEKEEEIIRLQAERNNEIRKMKLEREEEITRLQSEREEEVERLKEEQEEKLADLQNSFKKSLEESQKNHEERILELQKEQEIKLIQIQAEREEELNRYQKEQEEKSEILQEKIKEQQEWILSLEEENEEKTEQIKSLHDNLGETERFLQKQSDCLKNLEKEKDQKINELSAVKEIQKRVIKKQEKKRETLEQLLNKSKKEQQILADRLAHELQEKEAITEKYIQSQEISGKRDDNISHLQRLVAQQESLLNAREYRIQRLEELIGEYSQSTSWKLMEPFRRIGRFLRKGKTPALPMKEDSTGYLPEKSSLTISREEEQRDYWYYDKCLEKYHPLVSIIVPNYNHGQYLRERLDSIYSQTYDNYEVILLDDCSQDNSCEILSEYQARYPDITRCSFNEKNCGKIVLQWNKGISLARGSLIWIAESDDYCESDFLEKMVPLMERESVMLAFARSVFMTDGRETWNTEQYLSDIKDLRWDKPFTMTAARIVSKAFSVKNIIPNVSSALFRNTGILDNNMQQLMSGFKLSGDWVFYLDKIRGGCISYTNETTNYYRIHQESTSLKVQHTMDYYTEYEAVLCWIAKYYRVPEENLKQIQYNLKEHYRLLQQKDDIDRVDSYFSLERIKNAAENRKSNVIIGCFSIQPGGGETFAIYLANELREQDQVVTFLDFDMENHFDNLRQLIDPRIPLIRLRSLDDFYHVMMQLDADIIHTHHASVDIAVASWLKDPSIRTKQIITLHGMYDMMSREICIHTLSQVDPVCSRYIYIADKNLVPFEENGYFTPEKFVKLPNGLPVPETHKIDRKTLGIEEEDFVLVAASRGIPEKGWGDAAEAVKLANQKSSRKIHLIIIGDGEMRAVLEKNCPEYIHFVGVRDNVRDYFIMGDAGIVPTRFRGESYPLVIIECLQSGRPVIATDIAEVKNQLSDGKGNLAGILLHLKNWKLDTNEIADAILRMCNDPVFYQELASHCTNAAQKFDISKVTAAYIMNYREIMDQ